MYNLYTSGGGQAPQAETKWTWGFMSEGLAFKHKEKKAIKRELFIKLHKICQESRSISLAEIFKTNIMFPSTH